MTLPFLSSTAKKRDQIIAIDLGDRTTKAVLMQRKGERYALARYVIRDSPPAEKDTAPAVLAEHLRAVVQALDAKTKQVTLAIGSRDSILRNIELPYLPVNEMRQMLKFNTKSYLQQDLPDYTFDCYIVPPQKVNGPGGAPSATPGVEAGKSSPAGKYKVWVGGVKRQILATYETALKSAGLVPDEITLSLLGPTNAFELSPPVKEAVALVDLGFKSSSISIVSGSELCLSRIVEIGGHSITNSLAESMGISYAEAEGIKLGMPQEVEVHLLPALAPLGRDLRASIDFFEHHQDHPVGQVLICGGASRSEFFIQNLQTELMIPCQPWNPVATLELALPAKEAEELAQFSGLLAVATGSAATLF